MRRANDWYLKMPVMMDIACSRFGPKGVDAPLPLPLRWSKRLAYFMRLWLL